MIVASTCDKSHDDLILRHGKLTNMSDHISSQSLLPCLRRSKGLSTRLHRVSQSHQLAQPLPQVQPPSSQPAPLRLRLLKSYVNNNQIRTYYIKSWTHDLKWGFIISNHERMIWNEDLLHQIMNAWFEMRIYYIKSWMHDLKSGCIISNHKLMIWNQD